MSFGKVKDLQSKVEQRDAEIARLKADLKNAEHNQTLAVQTKEMQMQAAQFKAVEEALATGYQRALDNLKALKGFTSGL